jgi:hypothetical protein
MMNSFYSFFLDELFIFEQYLFINFTTTYQKLDINPLQQTHEFFAINEP